ncbi:response regulator [Paenibacillus sp. GCM10027626]|uniref:response regulator n=1 Tax=Paenibacillus sp. GCM10027626 TaxID=3273411 RepID=UPI003640CC7B
MKVLMIEDEPKVRRALKRLLLEIEPGIASFQEAETGLEGLELIEKERPDVLLLDMIMPEMNGDELLQLLRKRKIEIPVIVVSGHHDFAFVKQALASEAVDYILKPFDRDDVQAAWNKAMERLDKAQMQQQTEQLWQEMTREKSQQQRSAAISQLYAGRKLTIEEAALLPAFVQNRPCTVHVLVIRNYEHVLTNRFHNDQALLAYAIHKTIAEQAELSEHSMKLLSGSSSRYEWCYWLLTPAQPASGSHSGLQRLIDTLRQVLKLECFILSTAAEDHLAAGFANSIATLEDAIFKLDLSAGFANTELRLQLQQEQHPPAAAELQELISAFGIKAEHLVKHRLSFRIEHEVEELCLAAAKSHHLSVTLLYQAWSVLQARLLAHQASAIRTIEAFAVRIAFDESKGRMLLCETLQQLIAEEAAGAVAVSGNRALAVKDYIELCYAEDMSLADLADRFFISKEYLATQFKRQFGMTVLQYIQSTRLAKARSMLEDKSLALSVSAIAAAVGYDHFSYFDKLFKRTYGMTPSQYRLAAANN